MLLLKLLSLPSLQQKLVLKTANNWGYITQPELSSKYLNLSFYLAENR
jgi:hypothetical protein